MKDITILILGCDKYFEVAQRNYCLIKKLNPFLLDHIIFVTDKEVKLEKEFFKNILVIPNNNYSERIIGALKMVNTKYVLHFLDDDWITQPLTENGFDELVNFLNEEDIHYCKLLGNPKGKKIYSRKIKVAGLKLYKISPNRKYGMSLQPSIWKKELFLKVAEAGAKRGPTPWDTEIACYHFQDIEKDRIVTFNKSFIHSKNVVLKGKLFPWTNKILTDNDIPVLNYPVLTKKEYFSFNLKTKFLGRLPFKNTIKRLMRRRGYKFYSDEM